MKNNNEEVFSERNNNSNGERNEEQNQDDILDINLNTESENDNNYSQHDFYSENVLKSITNNDDDISNRDVNIKIHQNNVNNNNNNMTDADVENEILPDAFTEELNTILIENQNILSPEINCFSLETINEHSNSKSITKIESQCNEENDNNKRLNTNSVWSVGSYVCRICHTNEQSEGLISPCLCKGSVAHIHKSCLEYWLSTSGILYCEICHYEFNTEQTLRYTFLEALRIWYKNTNNRGLLQIDCFMIFLLTAVTLGLTTVCLLGFHSYESQEKLSGISKYWTKGSLIIFICIVICVYVINIFFIVKAQLGPFYNWWKSSRKVTLIIEDHRKQVNNFKRYS